MPFPALNPALERALTARAYTEPTPVQLAVVESKAEGRDMLVSAQTGSGKTVAFGLALSRTLLGDAERFERAAEPLALIIAPTRELAMQVQRELEWLYAETGARIATCVGGMDPKAERMALAAGAHIVVGTPGRLRDHLERRRLDLSKLRAAVLDEADEMLDLGFRDDLQFILDATPSERQTLMFSATVPRGIESLARSYQKNALRIETAQRNRQHDDIEYRAIRTVPYATEPAVVNLLCYFDAQAALVFCATREGVRRMHAGLAKRGFAAVALSGELSQAERTDALQALRDGRARVLVATDVAARGLDLAELTLVIHADLPNDAETLLHRSGRTGRAGRKGISVLIVPPNKRRRAEEFLSRSRINATWGNPPTAKEIAAKDQERLLALPILDELATAEDLALGRTLLEGRTPEQVAAALIRMHRATLPVPESLKDAGRPAANERPSRDVAPHRDRPERAQKPERAARPDRQPPREKVEHTEHGERSSPEPVKKFHPNASAASAPTKMQHHVDVDAANTTRAASSSEVAEQSHALEAPAGHPPGNEPIEIKVHEANGHDENAATTDTAPPAGEQAVTVAARASGQAEITAEQFVPAERGDASPREAGVVRQREAPKPTRAREDSFDSLPARRTGRDESSPSRPRSDRKSGSASGARGGRDNGEMVWFGLSIGRDKNADPRWLLPLICRAGDVTKQEIGSIRIEDKETRFEIQAEHAENFATAVKASKHKEGRIWRIGDEPAPAEAFATKPDDRPARSERPFAKPEGRPYKARDTERSSERPFAKPEGRPYKARDTERSADRPFSKPEGRPYKARASEGSADRPFSKPEGRPYKGRDTERSADRPFSKPEGRPYKARASEGSADRPFSKPEGRPYKGRDTERSADRTYPKPEGSSYSRPSAGTAAPSDRPGSAPAADRKPFNASKKPFDGTRKPFSKKPFGKLDYKGSKSSSSSGDRPLKRSWKDKQAT